MVTAPDSALIFAFSVTLISAVATKSNRLPDRASPPIPPVMLPRSNKTSESVALIVIDAASIVPSTVTFCAFTVRLAVGILIFPSNTDEPVMMRFVSRTV